MATNDPSNIRLGPCRILWGGVDLGLTKGGVEVEVTTSSKEVVVDQFGETPVNEYITGRKLMVKCPFAETDIDSLYRLMRYTGASLISTGAKATGNITFLLVPVADETVTVNGVVYTFKASPTLATHVLIGATAAASAANLASVLQLSQNPLISVATYIINSASPLVINVEYQTEGTAGNSFSLAESSTASLTVSGATLAGGTAAGRRRVQVESGIGISIQENAKELILRPVEKADDDFSEDFVVPLAGTTGALSFAYKTNDERLFNLSFTGFINTSTKVLFIYGDKR